MDDNEELESVVGACLEEQYKRQVLKHREWVEETLHSMGELDDALLLECIAQEMEGFDSANQDEEEHWEAVEGLPSVMQHTLCHEWWRRRRKLAVRDEDTSERREVEVPPSNRFHEWMQRVFTQ